LENGSSDVGVENRSNESFVAESVTASIHGGNVTTEEGVRDQDPEQTVSGSGSGSASEHRAPSVGNLDAGASNGAAIVVVGVGELNVLVDGVHPSYELLVGSEDVIVDVPVVWRVGGRLGDRGHVVVMSVVDVESASNGCHQIIDGLGNEDVPVNPYEVICPLIETLLVHVLNSLENESLYHPSEVGLGDRQHVSAELFLLLVDGVDEVFDLIGIDSDSLGRVEGPRTEEVECETLGKRGPRGSRSGVGELVSARILAGSRLVGSLTHSLIGFGVDDWGILLDFGSHSSFP